MPGDEARGGFLLTDTVDNVVAVQLAGLAQEDFFPIIVVVRAVLEMPRNAAIRPVGIPL